MRKLTTVVTLLGLVAGFSACSKDRDLDDYKGEQFQKEYAKTAVVSGVYTGSLKSAKSGQNLSAMQIILRASAAATTSTDQSGDSLKPIVSAQIIFAGGSDRAEVTIPNGNYETQTHVFHGNIQIPQDTGSTLPPITLDLTGTVGGDGSFIGTLAEDGLEDEGGTFSLSRNGASVDALAAQLDLGSANVFDTTASAISQTYKGTYTDATGKLNASMLVTLPPRTRLQALGDLLVPSAERFVTINLAVKDGKSIDNTIDFQSAEFDINERKLNAAQAKSLSGSLNPVTANLTFSCNNFSFQTKNYNFNCTYNSSLSGQNVTLSFHNP